MVDDQVVGVQALVFRVRLGVLEEVEQELGRLLWPATLGGAVDLGLQRQSNIGLVTVRLRQNRKS